VTGKSGENPARSRHRELHFGFWILDFGLKNEASSSNPKSKIQNPKWKESGYLLETVFSPVNVSRQNIRGGHGIRKSPVFL
jgi:hypothetical protein